MDTISPVLQDYNVITLWVLVIVSVLVIIASVSIGRFYYPIVSAFGMIGGILVAIIAGALISVNGDVDNSGTLAKISSHYQVILPPLTVDEFALSDSQSEIFTVSVTDARNQKVYPTARIVWDTQQISLMVPDEGTDEYVSLR